MERADCWGRRTKPPDKDRSNRKRWEKSARGFPEAFWFLVQPQVGPGGISIHGFGETSLHEASFALNVAYFRFQVAQLVSVS